MTFLKMYILLVSIFNVYFVFITKGLKTDIISESCRKEIGLYYEI